MPTGSDTYPEVGPFSEEQEGFIDFVRGLSDLELARVFSSYRFLAEFKVESDIWKRDFCRFELAKRFAYKSPSTASKAAWDRSPLPDAGS